jgi:hypothetical protein
VQLRITLSQPSGEVRELVELAAEGINTEGLTVWVKNCSHAFAGRAYFEARHCVVRIGRPLNFPIHGHHYPRLKTAPIYDLNSWQEALILVTAHELRHQQQFRNGWRRSEIDAERWALGRLTAFRGASEPCARCVPAAAATLYGSQLTLPEWRKLDGEDRC